AEWPGTGSVADGAFEVALLGEGLGREGRVQEGLSALVEALALVESKGEAFWKAELYRLQGELWLSLADQGTKGKQGTVLSFGRALNVAYGQRARSLALRAVTSLNRLDLPQRRRASARRLLPETVGWFTEGFDTLDFQEARALLEEGA